ncbi:hypothetical protein [Anaerobaca lacustris]|uniref:Uncharacterized protein n=1 Tax=Anaerobaca lacustris TaxID=3044600 RepID=A0AAW6U0T9_9BACT|nr:hypothetical protein [Sedimentisphaerales bacterium M17dextr]
MTTEENQLQWFIEWAYSPKDFFEELPQIQHEHCQLSIEPGKIIAKIEPAYGDPRPALRDQLHAKLEHLFIGIQLVSTKAFSLAVSSVYNQRSTGERNCFVEVANLVCVASVSADYKITDKDGKVIADSRAERTERATSVADLAAKYGRSDAVAGKILQSHRNAVDDPDNSLIHLYEICDALRKCFGSEREAQKKLDIKQAWKQLGRLANNEPLRQGRHRGRTLTELRDATKAELDTAFTSAQAMIERYLKHLDSTS